MATLEIHHADGNVTYAQLSRDKALMIGSAPNCDVVLSLPDVKRVHCRIVWREDRWRVETAADAGGVQLGDRMVKAGTIGSGDVLGIAGCRIYLDEPKAAAPVIQTSPFDSALPIGEEAELGEAEPVADLVRPTSARAPVHLGDQRTGTQRAWDSFRALFKRQFQEETHRPPGEERIIGSPFVRWLLIGVTIVLLLGYVFYTDYRHRTIDAHFASAQKAMDEGNWDGAIKQFTTFLAAYPAHESAKSSSSAARVQLALCEVEAAGSDVAGLEAAQKLLRERSKERAFSAMAQRIGSSVLRIAQGLASTAKDRADQTFLDRALEAKTLITRDLPGANLTANDIAGLDAGLDAARAAIKKANERAEALRLMDQAITDSKPIDVYRQREHIVQVYNDLATDADIEDRLDKARKLDGDAVRFEAAKRAAATEPRAGDIASSTLLIARTASAGDAAASEGDVVFSSGGGVLLAHDAASGKVLWHQGVGTDARRLPLDLRQTEPATLVTDLRHDELLAVQSRSGKLIWRQPIGERIEAAPLVHRGKIYQPTTTGKLIRLDAATGEVDGQLQFAPQRFTTTPAVDDLGRHLFLVGEQFVLYVITLDNPPRCEQVHYLEHRPDTIIASPIRVGRYLVLCENYMASDSRLRVLLLTTEGMVDQEIQQKPLAGWVHEVPSVVGAFMFVATDQESVQVYSAGPPEKADGFSDPVRLNPATAVNPRAQAHVLAYTERDVAVHGTKVRLYVYRAEQGELQEATAPKELSLEGAAALPIQRYPARGPTKLVVLTRRAPGSSAIYATALDAKSFEPSWEAQLATGFLSLVPADQAGAEATAVTRTGHVYVIPATTLKSGGVLDQPVGRIETNVALSGDIEPLVLPDASTVYTPAGEAKQLVVRPTATNAPVRRIELPAALEAPAAVFRDGDTVGLLVPAVDGRIYLMSAATGAQLCDPFQPQLDVAKPVEWRGVAVTEKGRILAVDNRGAVYPIELRKQPTPHLALKGDPAALSKPARSGLAIAGKVACCVDEENVLHTLNADTLEAIGRWNLPAPATLGPLAAAGHIFVVAGRDELVCVNAEGQRAWQHPLGGETPAGPPLVQGDRVYLATRGGLVRALRLTDGSEIGKIDAEKPLDSGLVAVGEMLVVAGDDGSLNVIRPPAASQ